jgi:2-oxoglutarate ferredoxin oxidoreductase subunit beta
MNIVSELAQKISELSAFEGKNKHTWCSGCGNFGIITAIKRALVLEQVAPHEVLMCYDVGCNGNESDKINANTIHGLHGRVIPLAAGAKIANKNLEVIAQAGDGATFSEGINHLIHAVRNNYNITFICHNNQNYGLTIGQASSTTRRNVKMNSTPDGVFSEPLNSLEMILALKPTFVARGFNGNIEHMTKIIREGMNHQGFSYIEILQACPTFNKDTPQEWYWDKIKYTTDLGHDTSDIWAARKLVADDLDGDIALGVIYQDKTRPSFEQTLISRQNRTTTLVDEVQQYDISNLIKSFI